MNRHRITIGLLVAVLGGCGTEVAEVADAEDFSHPALDEDADLPEGADVPLLPPIDDDPDAAVGDVSSVVDAAIGVDVLPVVDVPAVRDASTPSPVDAGVRCVGSASGQSSIWTCNAARSARQRCVAGAVQTEACARGCVAQPSGTNDYCAPPAPAPSTTLPTCTRRPLLRSGLHPDASDHLRCAGVPAARITQTIGYATASAGTHGPDGRVAGVQYSAATDLSTRGLTAAEIRTLLSRLADQGFAAWYRWPGHDGWPASEAPHIHAIYVGAAMKSSLRSQVRSWLDGRNGLVSNTRYTFYSWSAAQIAMIRAVFNRFN